MKNKSKFNARSKGSVLIAVIGILAVLSVMALRFNVEMETAMVKTTGKSLSSDVKVLADSGLNYCISMLLANGERFGKAKPAFPFTNDHSQLAIEEDMEMKNDVDDGLDILGSGVSSAVSTYNASNFYLGRGSTEAAGYIPDSISLNPGKINFMIEDLSGKLPIGHVSQAYQRHLITNVLCDLLASGKVPSNKTVATNSELFEATETTQENGYDYSVNRHIYLRSLIPYWVASLLPSGNSDHKNVAGLPLADGIISSEELGSSYTWQSGAGNNPFSKKIATDLPRGSRDYQLLSTALTPYTRFIHDPNFDVKAPTPSTTNVTYASINPLVMSRQNLDLYKSLFYYDPNDIKLKMQFSVGFPPKDSIPTDIDDVANLKEAIASSTFFESQTDTDLILSSAMPGITGIATPSISTICYNARNSDLDLHGLPASASFVPLKDDVPAKVKQWVDAEFANKPDKKTAYYIAMDRAVERLERAFKGTGVHKLPAESLMCPIVTRKFLEVAIIKAVFGDSITLVGPSILNTSKTTFLDNVEAGSTLNYMQLFRAVEQGKIDLKKVLFVENALSKYQDPLADKYFVPFWEKYDHLLVDTKWKSGNSDIKVPSFGLYFDGTDYFNYLPHPQTDQRMLGNSYVSIATVYSFEFYDPKLISNDVKGSINLDIPKLYIPGMVNTPIAYFNDSSSKTPKPGDAYYDLTAKIIVTPKPTTSPSDGYLPLYNTDPEKIPGLTDSDKMLVNFVAADFSPYETKIRMAVLVNLLNSIIPAKISPTKNVASGEENSSLFSLGLGGVAKNLHEFIYLKNGQYYVNINNSSASTDYTPPYLNGWDGGIKTPGMTFWKFGVHSTTFQCTVDAFKYDDSTRLTGVVTFDMYDDTSVKSEVSEKHSNHKYILEKYDQKQAINSSLYLNPKGRYNKSLPEKYVIGKGEMRYPTDTNTDSWRIINYTWSETFGRNTKPEEEYFVPILLFPSTMLNNGPDGGNWHFEKHPSEAITFDKFFMDINNTSSMYIGSDYSKGSLNSRKFVCGAGSWVQWEAYFTKDEPANGLKLVLYTNPGNAYANFTMIHRVTITNKDTNVVVFSKDINTYSNGGRQSVYESIITVPVPKGNYVIRLTELKNTDSGPYSNAPEMVTQVAIYEK